MPAATEAALEAPQELVDALAAEVAAQGALWFPELDGAHLAVRHRGGTVRPRCFLHRFDVLDGRSTRPVMVKVRHSRAELRREDRCADRPVLAPVRELPDAEASRREFDGLRLIADALAGDDTGRFGVLRPLAFLPEQAAVVTDLSPHPTLRSVLLQGSRLRPGRRALPGDEPWRSAGAWLRLFHSAPTSLELPARAGTAAEAGELLARYAGFVRERVGCRPVLDELISGGADLARAALPAQVPLGTGHGDFVATNVFLGPGDRITVFDPFPMWRLPVHQDLATLVVGLRVMPVQAASQGLALDRRVLAGYEEALLQGYFGDEPVPGPAVAVYQLLALLDRWAALAGQQVRGGRARRGVHDGRIRLASRHYAREAGRITAEAVGERRAGV